MRLRIIDAFTDRPFSGNPAGVMLLDAFPDDERLQRIAAEVNLSETAFAHPLEPGGEADWALRWFTPLREVDLCGHATLATAHALTSDGRVAPGGGPLRFAT
ncbi:PhzF family phenazine biosynthesis protein, partial [Streptomyces sp. ZG43]